MTRYIYLVRSGGPLSPDAAPVAAFTDTRELAGWLRGKNPSVRALLKVFRMEDGGSGAAVELSVDDLMNLSEEDQ